jgi:hypothetical protein
MIHHHIPFVKYLFSAAANCHSKPAYFFRGEAPRFFFATSLAALSARVPPHAYHTAHPCLFSLLFFSFPCYFF